MGSNVIKSSIVSFCILFFKEYNSTHNIMQKAVMKNFTMTLKPPKMLCTLLQYNRVWHNYVTNLLVFLLVQLKENRISVDHMAAYTIPYQHTYL